MSADQTNPTYEEISSVALRAALWSHLHASVIVFAVLWAKGYSSEALGYAVFILVFFLTFTPFIVASAVTEVVGWLLVRWQLPLPLFVWTCTMILQATLLGWALVLIDMGFGISGH